MPAEGKSFERLCKATAKCKVHALYATVNVINRADYIEIFRNNKRRTVRERYPSFILRSAVTNPISVIFL